MTDAPALRSAGPWYAVRLSRGLGCRLAGADEVSAGIAARVASSMHLETSQQEDYTLPPLWLTSDASFSPPPGEESCLLPIGEPEELFCCLLMTSAAIARMLLPQGALLLHAALATTPGEHSDSHPMQGVLLAAPGGTGKSTAARRLPSPWKAWCDDAVLVIAPSPDRRTGAVPLRQTVWAHPWPTWSRFFDDGPGGSWPVRTAVPLTAVYFLQQADREWIAPIGPGQAVVRLNESATQLGRVMLRKQPVNGKRAVRRAVFDLSATLAQRLPCADLHLSLHGAFWQPLEADLAGRIQSLEPDKQPAEPTAVPTR